MRSVEVRAVTVWDTLMTTDGRRAKVRISGRATGELYRGQWCLVWYVEDGPQAHINQIDFLPPSTRVRVA